ncbi:MAG: hypothetical protein JSU83_15775 [Deltaproteobacteria bacterium]|nr:MAG: hypothetical protein JSU83_15775 [Deltaproteobacteria bacterium]
MKSLFVCLTLLLFMGCAQTQPIQKDKSLEDLKNVLRQSEKEIQRQHQEYFEKLIKALEDLEKECTDLRVLKNQLNDRIQRFKTAQDSFLSGLNQEQFGLYSEWYGYLSKNNFSQAVLFAKKLVESLDENKQIQFRNLYAIFRETSGLARDFHKKSKEFEKKKFYYLNLLRKKYQKNYATLEGMVNQVLTY